MYMPKSHIKQIYERLFQDGVMVAHEDLNLKSHMELLEVPNLHVVKLMLSLKSKGFVRETRTWRHRYFYLNNEGIEYLRDYLHLPSEIVPDTIKKQEKQVTIAPIPSASRNVESATSASEQQEFRAGYARE